MKIHMLEIADLDAINAIEKQAYAQPWSLKQLADSLKGEHVVWGLKRDGDLLAYLIWMRAVDEVHILNLAVDPMRQRTGLAKVLLQSLLNEARSSDAHNIFLEVRVSNTPALALYESIGFCEMGRRRNYYPCAHGREDAILMGMSW